MKKAISLILVFVFVLSLGFSQNNNVLVNALEQENWTLLEDYNTPGKTFANYMISGTSNGSGSLIDKGQGDMAIQYKGKHDIGLLYAGIKEYPNTKWVKFDFKGPQTGEASDGYFRIQPGINDAIANYRMANLGQVNNDYTKTGYVFIKGKNDSVWTKIQSGAIINLPNNFDGEIMYNLDMFSVNNGNNSVVDTRPVMNKYFSDRMLIYDLESTESVVIDNFCVSDNDMTPSEYKISLQSADVPNIANVVSDKNPGRDFTYVNGNRAIKLPAYAENFSQEIMFSGGKDIRGAKYYEFYIEGPGGENNNGKFQFQPTLHGDGYWLRMSNPKEVDYDNERVGAIYIKEHNEEKFIRYNCGAKILLDNDFKGIIRCEIDLFNNASGENTEKRIKNILTGDTSWFSYFDTSTYLVVDDYYAIVSEDMVKGVDYTVDGENNDYDPLIIQNFESVNDVNNTGKYNSALPMLIDYENGKALELAAQSSTIGVTVTFNNANLSNAKFIEFSLAGPDRGKQSSGYFDLTPAIHTEDGYHRLLNSSDDNPDNLPLGKIYYQPKGSEAWYEIDGNSKFRIAKNFEGKIRIPTKCYLYDTVKKKIGTPKYWENTISTSDYFGGLLKEEKIILDDYTAIYTDIVSEISETLSVEMKKTNDEGTEILSPQTGDSQTIVLFEIFLIISVLGIFCTLRSLKRYNR